MTKSLVSGELGLLATGLFLLVPALLGIHLYLCFGTPNAQVNKEARFSLVIATVNYCLVLGLAELFVPPSFHEYTKIQKNLQRQFERRNHHRAWVFRGVTLRESFNELGWADKPRDYAPSENANRVVFIGDSMLEWASSKNMPALTEELLRSRGFDVELINLSLGGTGLEDYRHRFYEFALDLKPRHIFLFVTELNDYGAGYAYQAYINPPIRITREATEALADTNIKPESKASLLRLAQEDKIFDSKASLSSELRNIGLNYNQIDLAYLASYAYSPGYSPIIPFLPKFSFLVTRNVRWLITAAKHLLSNDESRTKRPYHLDIFPKYLEIFKLPKNERLEAIAKFISREYLHLDNYTSTLAILRQQTPQFISYVTSTPDFTYYLLPAVDHASSETDFPILRVFRPAEVDASVRLFLEMHQMAAARGIGFTVVLIPEASYGDEQFREFWAPMLDFQEYFSAVNRIHTALKKKLSGKMPLIDLTEFPDRLRGGYWKMDGHWNEKGNAQVSEIMADYMARHLNLHSTSQEKEPYLTQSGRTAR